MTSVRTVATTVSDHIVTTLDVIVDFDTIVTFVTLLTSSPVVRRKEHVQNFSVLQEYTLPILSTKTP